MISQEIVKISIKDYLDGKRVKNFLDNRYSCSCGASRVKCLYKINGIKVRSVICFRCGVIVSNEGKILRNGRVVA